MSFVFTPLTEMPDVLLIKTKQFNDNRGMFMESFREKDFLNHGIPKFVQENHSRTGSSCIRGMHYQLKDKAQGKLVRCISGSITDVVIDIRKNSPTYGKWASILLKTPNEMLYVPLGFAHGFATTYSVAHVIYKTTEYYSPKHERCIRYNDPSLGIEWPRPPFKWVVSDKDTSAPLLKNAENDFVYGE